MNSILNNRVLSLIPVVFFFIILLKITFSYINLEKKEMDFAKKETQVLGSYALVHRNYYQSLFINKTIPLNESTLKALPAYSNQIISQEFSKENSLNITIRTVSDRARNPLNNADKEELKAIDFFNKNKKSQNYFNAQNSLYYQYASALRVEKKCLICHSSRENAPAFIRNKYNKAYDYKLNELRGVLSIKIPKESVKKYFFTNFIETTIFDILLFIALYFGMLYLTKRSKFINKMLAIEIENKTYELKNTYVIDKLTSLPNRQKLIEDIKSNDRQSHLALLNIDAFKDINDFYGYHSGDSILKDIATILTDANNNTITTIYKLPSDEFAILSIEKIDTQIFIKNIEYIISLIHKHHFTLQDSTISIVISCGISNEIDELMTTADIALQKAKSRNKSLIIYNEKFNITKQVLENRKYLAILREAIEHDRITPFFQAIYNLETDTIEKYECLARIVQEDGSVITPNYFIDIAIKSKLYTHITKSMIDKSFEYFKDKDYEFSINLSIVEILNKETAEYIIEKLKQFPEPKRVVFEILENEKIGNYENVKRFINTIKHYGCKFAIDDFGSGYSNFSHVYELNIEYIKIDASLVKYIASNDTSRIITKTIINFSSNLGLKTIAEFVEDIESFEILKKMGVNYIQGYYIGKPQASI